MRDSVIPAAKGATTPPSDSAAGFWLNHASRVRGFVGVGRTTLRYRPSFAAGSAIAIRRRDRRGGLIHEYEAAAA